MKLSITLIDLKLYLNL